MCVVGILKLPPPTFVWEVIVCIYTVGIKVADYVHVKCNHN